MRIKDLVIFLIAIVIFVSCSETSEPSLVSEITGSVDSLKQIYAPDSRVALWNVSILKKHDSIDLIAEVESNKTKVDLLKLKAKYPSLRVSVRVLPLKHAGFTSFALINNSVSSIRKGRSRATEMLNQALLGTPVKVYKKKGEWYLIQTPNQYFGWINKADIVLLDSARLPDLQKDRKIVFNRQYGFSYSKPDKYSQVVSDLVIGDILPITGSKGQYYKVMYPDGRIAFVKKNEVIDFRELINRKPTGKNLVNTALKFNGIPYLWGGLSSKAIDCSGFTSTIYFLNGIILQRDASQQTKYGKEITTDFVSKDLQPGDLLFFGRKATDSLSEKVTHVAMYIGNGEFIHSSGKVKISSMNSSKTNYIPEYVSRFVRGVRMIGQDNGTTIQKLSENKFYQILRSK